MHKYQFYQEGKDRKAFSLKDFIIFLLLFSTFQILLILLELLRIKVHMLPWLWKIIFLLESVRKLSFLDKRKIFQLSRHLHQIIGTPTSNISLVWTRNYSKVPYCCYFTFSGVSEDYFRVHSMGKREMKVMAQWIGSLSYFSIMNRKWMQYIFPRNIKNQKYN